MKLLDFIKNEMRMEHYYQPIMIKALLENNGILPDVDIAKEIIEYKARLENNGTMSDVKIAINLLINDISQIKYYKNRTNNIVGKVLRNHKIVEKIKDKYVLNEYSDLKKEDIKTIIEECDNKIKEFREKKGLTIWKY